MWVLDQDGNYFAWVTRMIIQEHKDECCLLDISADGKIENGYVLGLYDSEGDASEALDKFIKCVECKTSSIFCMPY